MRLGKRLQLLEVVGITAFDRNAHGSVRLGDRNRGGVSPCVRIQLCSGRLKGSQHWCLGGNMANSRSAAQGGWQPQPGSPVTTLESLRLVGCCRTAFGWYFFFFFNKYSTKWQLRARANRVVLSSALFPLLDFRVFPLLERKSRKKAIQCLGERPFELLKTPCV